MSEMITIPIQVEAEEFWSNLLGSSFETWSWWRSVKYSEGSDWDKVGEITLSIDDPEDEDKVITKTLTLQDLADAYAKFVLETKQFVNWEDFDACDGDAVLQTAILGEVVYG